MPGGFLWGVKPCSATWQRYKQYQHLSLQLPLQLSLQVIDGQQRLTTLVMLLSYLRAWSATQPGLESLAERVHRMLLIPADPLNPTSKARYVGSSWAHVLMNSHCSCTCPARMHLDYQMSSNSCLQSAHHLVLRSPPLFWFADLVQPSTSYMG